MDRILIFTVVVVALGAFGFLRWKAGLRLFFLLVIADGAIRKWLVPEAQQFLYFLKDFLLVGIYLRVLGGGRASVIPSARGWAAMNVIMAFMVTVEIFNPALPSLALGFVGWKSYLLYIPLVFVMPYLFDSMEQLVAELRRYSILALPVVLLGVVQFFSGTDSALNSGLMDSTGMTSEQAGFQEVERVRVAGPFPFVSGFTAFLVAVLAFALALLNSARDRSHTTNWATYLIASACVVGMFMSGSRGPVVTAVVMVIVYFSMCGALGIVRGRQVRAAWVSLALVVAVVFWVVPDAMDAWTARTSTLEADVDPIFLRIFSEFTELMRVAEWVGIFGSGTGATHNAAVSIIELPLWSWLPTIAEGELARVALELGLVGWLLVYAPRVAIIATLWNEARRTSDPSTAAIVAAVCAELIVLLPAHIMINPVANVYYYGSIGLAFAAIKLTARARVVEPSAWIPARQYGGRQPG